jgi:putative NADH-flavin reductase
MHVLILGCGGGVGAHLVPRALSLGDRVSVLLRPGREVALPDSVRVVRGHLNEASAVMQALEGVDAVLSAVGMQRRQPWNPWSSSISPPDLTSSMAEHLVAAMKQTGVQRVIAVSAAGVGDSAAGLNLLMRFFLATTMIGDAYRDLARMEQIFAESGLDWLCPRPTRLTHSQRKRTAQVVARFGLNDAVSRANVARWMLDTLHECPRFENLACGRTPQLADAPALDAHPVPAMTASSGVGRDAGRGGGPA